MREDNLFDRCLGYVFLYGLTSIAVSGMYKEHIQSRLLQEDRQIQRVYKEYISGGVKEVSIEQEDGTQLHLAEFLH